LGEFDDGNREHGTVHCPEKELLIVYGHEKSILREAETIFWWIN
jgi:hypothetical protein